MLKIQFVLNAVTAAIQAIKPLTDLAPVTAYDDEISQYKSVLDAIHSMDVPSILISHEGTELGREPGTDFPRWVHLFHVYFRFERNSEGWDAIDALINGVPDLEDGSTWMNHDPDPGLYPPLDVAIDYIVNQDGVSLPRLSFRTLEMGG